jgi:hypothetical protein
VPILLLLLRRRSNRRWDLVRPFSGSYAVPPVRRSGLSRSLDELGCIVVFPRLRSHTRVLALAPGGQATVGLTCIKPPRYSGKVPIIVSQKYFEHHLAPGPKMLDCSESQALARCGRVWQCVAPYLGMLERIRFFHERYEHSPLYIRLLLKGIFSREN